MVSEIFLRRLALNFTWFVVLVIHSVRFVDEDLSFETSDLGCSGSRGIMITIWDKSYALFFSFL